MSDERDHTTGPTNPTGETTAGTGPAAGAASGQGGKVQGLDPVPHLDVHGGADRRRDRHGEGLLPAAVRVHEGVHARVG